MSIAFLTLAQSLAFGREEALACPTLPVKLGESLGNIQAAFQPVEPLKTLDAGGHRYVYLEIEPPRPQGATSYLYIGENKLVSTIYFSADQTVEGFNLSGTSSGSILGLTTGDSLTKMRSVLGEPQNSWDLMPKGHMTAYVYDLPSSIHVRVEGSMAKNRILSILVKRSPGRAKCID